MTGEESQISTTLGQLFLEPIGTWQSAIANYFVYFTVSLPCSNISRFQTNPARE
jgi:hypothetical protein